jgi:non-reducing end alpha-L-arabinofuranosidase
MKKIRSVVPVSFALSLSAVVSCGSFSAEPDEATGAGGGGQAPAPSGAGASSVAMPGAPVDPAGSAGASGSSEAVDPDLPVDPAGSAGTAGNSEVVTTPGAPIDSAGGSGAMGSAGTAGEAPTTTPTPVAPSTPCGILAAAGHPCVSAHSTTRVIAGDYTGPLYQVCRGASTPGPNSCPGGNVIDIGVVEGGYADAAAQDAFCEGGACTISIIYDQSGSGNHLHPAPRGGFKPTPDNPAVANDLPVTLNGHKAYGIFIKPGIGYRAGCTGCAIVDPVGTAVGDEPETEYMVTSQDGLVNGCCFNYGNAETTSNDDGNGTMEAVYFGGGVVWGTGSPGGHNNGPWVMADLENGLYAGWERNQDQAISTNTPIRFPFVTAVVVGDTQEKNNGAGRFALYGGNANAGNLQTLYDGIRPAKPGYVPMQKQGSIILGIGGDNSGGAGGRWYEGVMASGAATLATVNALQTNIVAAGYGR